MPIVLLGGHVPDRSIGAGESLRDIHWIDLARDWSSGIEQLLAAVAQAKVAVDPLTANYEQAIVNEISALPPALGTPRHNLPANFLEDYGISRENAKALTSSFLDTASDLCDRYTSGQLQTYAVVMGPEKFAEEWNGSREVLLHHGDDLSNAGRFLAEPDRRMLYIPYSSLGNGTRKLYVLDGAPLRRAASDWVMEPVWRPPLTPYAFLAHVQPWALTALAGSSLRLFSKGELLAIKNARGLYTWCGRAVDLPLEVGCTEHLADAFLLLAQHLSPYTDSTRMGGFVIYAPDLQEYMGHVAFDQLRPSPIDWTDHYLLHENGQVNALTVSEAVDLASDDGAVVFEGERGRLAHISTRVIVETPGTDVPPSDTKRAVLQWLGKLNIHGSFGFAVSADGPVRIWLNGEQRSLFEFNR